MTPEEVAEREFLEEVGGTAAESRYVGEFYTSNGISSEIVMSTSPPALSWRRPTGSPPN